MHQTTQCFHRLLTAEYSFFSPYASLFIANLTAVEKLDNAATQS